MSGKIELFKCAQIKDLYSNEYDNYAFQLNIHNTTIIFKAITNDVRNNLIQAIGQTIEQNVCEISSLFLLLFISLSLQIECCMFKM